MAAPRGSDFLGLELGCGDRPCQPVPGTYGGTVGEAAGGGGRGPVRGLAFWEARVCRIREEDWDGFCGGVRGCCDCGEVLDVAVWRGDKGRCERHGGGGNKATTSGIPVPLSSYVVLCTLYCTYVVSLEAVLRGYRRQIYISSAPIGGICILQLHR
jgi:hypothetical protein